MEFLSDDPTYLAGGFGLLAGVFLIAVKLTQQGKYLVWAACSLAMALLVVGVERIWVSDNERIEQTVYTLCRAVETADASGALDCLTSDVQYVASGNSAPGEITRARVERHVMSSKFDYLRITHLRTNAGGQSRRGTADFHLISGGSLSGGSSTQTFGSATSSWSLGLREMSPGVWKVNRITPVDLPGQNLLPSAYFRPDTSPRDDGYREYPPRGSRLRRVLGRRAASELDSGSIPPTFFEP